MTSSINSIKIMMATLILFLLNGALVGQNDLPDMKKNTNQSFYDFTATSIDGETIPMSNYKGKVVVVVNTASECGFTPQYGGLEALYEKYGDQGLEILGFPCNQFGKQEPGSDKDIASFCQLNYGVSFQMFSKIDVNGSEAHPLYKFLKNEKGGLLGSKIKWNFTKFLIDRNGNVVERFGTSTKPEQMEKDIVSLL
jgi:glutathione peroxidase